MDKHRSIKLLTRKMESIKGQIDGLEDYLRGLRKSEEDDRGTFVRKARKVIADHMIPHEGKRTEFLRLMNALDDQTRGRKVEAESHFLKTAKAFEEVESRFLGVNVHMPSDEAGWGRLTFWAPRWEKKLRDNPQSAAELYKDAMRAEDSDLMYWMEEEGVGILKEVRSSLGSDNPDMMRVIHSGLVLDKLIEQSIPEFTQMREQLAHLEDRLKEKAREIKSISTVEDERRHLIERLMPKDEASATPKVLFEAGIGHLFPELSAHQEIYDQTQYSGSDETHPAKILPADATLAERLQGGLRGSHRDK